MARAHKEKNEHKESEKKAAENLLARGFH